MNEFAETLQTYGGWGVCSILMVAVIALWKENRGLSKQFREDMMEILTGTTKALTENTMATERQTQISDGVLKAIAKCTKE